MIDLHCHYLPGIDDGAATLDESLALARAAVANGITHAVMTPHIHIGVFENRKKVIDEHVATFRAALRRNEVGLEISAGAEVRVGPELIELLEEDAVPFIGQLGADKVLLLELPHGSVPVGVERLINWLRARGIRPLIAHPERNKDIMRNFDKIEPFIRAGCLVQLTAGSITGRFGPYAQRSARRMLEEDWVFAIATDAHNLEHRPPDLAQARAEVEKLLGVEEAALLTRINPERLLGTYNKDPGMVFNAVTAS